MNVFDLMEYRFIVVSLFVLALFIISTAVTLIGLAVAGSVRDDEP